MCLRNYIKLPISHKRGMEITCCSIMSHCLFYQYCYKQTSRMYCEHASLYYVSDVLAIITKSITY